MTTPQAHALPAASLRRFSPWKSLGLYRDRSLDLDAGNPACLLQDEIHLRPVLVAIVADQDIIGKQFGLPCKLREDEPFEQASEPRTILPKLAGINAPESGKQACVEKVEFRRLDEALQVVAMSCPNAAQDEHLFKQRQPPVNRLAVHAQRLRKCREVQQLA